MHNGTGFTISFDNDVIGLFDVTVEVERRLIWSKNDHHARCMKHVRVDDPGVARIVNYLALPSWIKLEQFLGSELHAESGVPFILDFSIYSGI